MAGLPPSYSETISWQPSAPMLPSYQETPQQTESAVEAMESLVQEMRMLQGIVQTQQPEIINLQKKVFDKEKKLEESLFDWYKFLSNMIHQQFIQKKKEIYAAAETEVQRIHDVDQRCLQAIRGVDRLAERALVMAKTGNAHDIARTKSKVQDYIKDLKECRGSVYTISDRWFFKKANILPNTIQGLMGTLFMGSASPSGSSIPSISEPSRSNLEHRRSRSSSRGRTSPSSADSSGGQSSLRERRSRSSQSPGGRRSPRDSSRGGHSPQPVQSGPIQGTGPGEPEDNSSSAADVEATSFSEPEEQEAAEAQTSSADAPSPEERDGDEEGFGMPSNYQLLYSFHAKTYKDKARCHPLGLVYTVDGCIIVPDKFNKNVKVFTERGQLIKEITHPQMLSPVCAVLAPNGELIVGDAESRDLKFFSLNGRFNDMRKLNITPSTIAVTSEGDIVIGDSLTKQVHYLNMVTGVTKLLISRYQLMVPMTVNTERGPQTVNQYRLFDYFQNLRHVVVAPGLIFVCDRSAHNVQSFKMDGTFIARYGTRGQLLGQFQEPYGMAVSPDGTLMIADYENHRIQVMTLNGEFRDPILDSDQHELKFPTSVTITPDLKIIVTEYLSGLVRVFGTDAHVGQTEVREMPPDYGSVFNTHPAPSAPPSSPPPQASLLPPSYSHNNSSASESSRESFL